MQTANRRHDGRSETENKLQLITEAKAAEILGVTPSALRTMRKEGRGPGYFKVEKSIRYAEDEVEAFLQAGRRDHGN